MPNDEELKEIEDFPTLPRPGTIQDELDSFVRIAQITEVQGEFNDYVCCLRGVYMRLLRPLNFSARDKNSNKFK